MDCFQRCRSGDQAAVIEARVSSEQPGAALEVRLDAADGTLAGRVDIAQSGAQQWSTVKADLQGAAGQRDIYIILSAGVRISHFEIR